MISVVVAHNERKYVTSSEGRLVRLGLEFLGEQIEYGSLKRKDVLFDLEFTYLLKPGSECRYLSHWTKRGITS